MKIIKRNGTIVDFDRNKIINALNKANKEMTSDEDKITDRQINNIVTKIEKLNVENNTSPTVEGVQDNIEQILVSMGKYKLAKHYITYRYERQLARDKYNQMMSVVKTKLEASAIQNQNANVDESSFGGRVGEASNHLMKQYALDFCVPKWMRENHVNNRIYIHDLDAYADGRHNCLSIPFDKLLSKGFTVKQTDVRPANSINTAMQLVAVIFQLQSLQQFGGVSATHLDWTMEPYVKKSFRKHLHDGLKYVEKQKDNQIKRFFNYFKGRDLSIKCHKEVIKHHKDAYDYACDMTRKETHQAVEALYHNLNTLQSRSGCQLPFTSINFGTCTSPEGRLVTEELLRVCMEGLGKFHRTSIFPCTIFQSMEGVNRKPGDPNYDLYRLALECTSKRLYPNYANVNWSGNAGFDLSDPKTYFSTMGCRTANGFDINGMGQTKDGRGNICPTTIILPTLAMEAKECYVPEYDEHIVDVFLSILDKAIDDAKDSLIERFNYICNHEAASAKFMYENGTMEGYIPEEGIRSALKHGTLAIGQLGLAEALQILIHTDHTTEMGMKVAKQIEQLFKDKCMKFKEEYKLNFGVYYTPAENLCKTAMINFRKKYGIIPEVSDREYFTNSMHVPVWKDLTPFEKIDIESQLTGYSSAGCITYVELPSTTLHNIDAVEKIVNYAMVRDIPYFAINVPNDQCMDCGFTAEMNDKCIQCGSSNINRLRRVTGYLSTDYHNFNAGKIAEVEDRVKHTT